MSRIVLESIEEETANDTRVGIFDLITPVIVCNSDNYSKINTEKIGKVKCKSSYNMDLTKISKFINPHISHNGRCWILTLGIEIENRPHKTTDEVIGIDLGVKELAVCSNGMVFKNINKTNQIKKLEKRLKHLQRKERTKVLSLF